MPEVPALSRTAALTARVERALADDGPLAAAFEGYESRPGQRRLAGEVAATFYHGGTLVAEAGTGTGKTLAYLVPAVLAGRRVLVSTGTRTLQDQIFYKDLPALARALGIEIRAAYMKGQSNYLCWHRFDRLQEAEAGLPVTERRWLRQIAEWARETATGDRAEIEDLPDEMPFWAELSATAEQCLGRECPRHADCFVTRMRERATEADVVIVNHHLLCADASVRLGDFGEVIPPCDLAVIDEAHQLEDVVTQYFGVSLSTFRIEEFARDATQAIATLGARQDGLASRLTLAVSDAQHSARGLFNQAKLELRSDRVTLTPDAAARLSLTGAELGDALDQVAGLARSGADATEDLATIATRASALRADLETLLAIDDGRFVHFVEGRGRGVFLRAAPIDVAEIIRETVLGGRSGTVLTSATLTVEASFEYVQGRLGVNDARTVRLPAEFDYSAQAILFLPREMPDPRSPDFNRAAAAVTLELLDRTEGRAFVLFTSYAAMHEVRSLIEGRIGWPLFVQGTAPRTALLRDFRATPNAVLLATSSFWQGVDVVGEALSCVIIDRLPFASPSDPLVAARISAVERRGGNAFGEYQVPLATLTLLQGLGRLIRSRTDRGVMAVLDPRLRTKAYGRRFLASFPDAPVTSSLAAVTEFMRPGTV